MKRSVVLLLGILAGCATTGDLTQRVSQVGWAPADSEHPYVSRIVSRAAGQAFLAKGVSFDPDDSSGVVLRFRTRIDIRDSGFSWINKGHQTGNFEVNGLERIRDKKHILVLELYDAVSEKVLWRKKASNKGFRQTDLERGVSALVTRMMNDIPTAGEHNG